MTIRTILLIIVVILLLTGGEFGYRRRRAGRSVSSAERTGPAFDGMRRASQRLSSISSPRFCKKLPIAPASVAITVIA